MHYINKNWYYFDDQNANALTGLQEIGDDQYDFDTTNANALTGWQNIKDFWYYFDKQTAKMLTGWQEIDGQHQYFSWNGKWDSNAVYNTPGQWYHDKEKKLWNYYKGAGRSVLDLAQAEMLTINGKNCYFDWGSKLIQNDKYLYDGHYYYADNNGYMVFDKWVDTNTHKVYSRKDKDRGLIPLNASLMYVNKDGTLAGLEVKIIDGNQYHFTILNLMDANTIYSVGGKDYYAGQDGITVASQWNGVNHGLNWIYSKADMTLANSEVCTINGKKYYFDDKDYLLENGTYTADGKTYYAGKDGSTVSNQWNKLGVYWIYSKKDGSLAKDEVITIDGKQYRFDSDCHMLQDSMYYIGSKKYYAGTDGVTAVGKWNHIKGLYWIYSKADGTLAKDEALTIDHKQYKFDSDAHMLQNAVYSIGSQSYYAGQDGSAVTNQWNNVAGGYRIYSKADSTLAKSEVLTLGNYTYYFDYDGHLLQNGEYSIGSKRYYVDADGHTVYKTWHTTGDNTRYSKVDGTLANNELLTIDGKRYCFNSDNDLVRNNRWDIDSKAYYMDKDGVVVTNQWITINGAKNYAQADGTLLTNTVATINGKKYVFGWNCALVRNDTYRINGITYATNSDGVVISESV